MPMKTRTSLTLLALAGALAAQEPSSKITLGVLYAGVLDSPRTADFKEFLESHFTKVGTVELATLDRKAAEGYDVVIVDSPSPFKGDNGFELPKAGDLDLDFTRPTILMGAAGGKVLRSLQIKLDWL
jgi:hypothetical protein